MANIKICKLLFFINDIYIDFTLTFFYNFANLQPIITKVSHTYTDKQRSGQAPGYKRNIADLSKNIAVGVTSPILFSAADHNVSEHSYNTKILPADHYPYFKSV